MSGFGRLTNDGSEPSMEDILSSIRNVIALDKAKAQKQENVDKPDDAPVEKETAPTIETTSDLVESVLELGDAEAVEDVAQAESASVSADARKQDRDLAQATDLPQAEETETLSSRGNESDEDILELSTPLDEDVELETLEIPQPEPESKLAEPRSPAPHPEDFRTGPEAESETEAEESGIGFDEAVDLVLGKAPGDSSADDSLKDNVEPTGDDGHSLPETRVEGELDVVDWRQRAELDTVQNPANAAGETEANPPSEAPSPELSSPEALLAKIEKSMSGGLEDTSLQEEREKGETSEDVYDFEADENALSEDDPQDGFSTDEQSARPTSTQDEDMDLVKSLLADLMDEPETQENDPDDIEAQGPEETKDSVGDMPGDPFLEESFQEASDVSTSASEEDVNDMETESELHKLARELEAQQAETPTSSEAYAETEDDLEDLLAQPKDELVSRLSLVGTAAAVGAGAGLVSAVSESKETSDDMAEADSARSGEAIADAPGTVDEPTTEKPVIDDTDDIAPLIEDIQEEENMPRALEEQPLLDETTAQEAENAFASLSKAVQEKELAEENGPPIGELVKEALRPMLQEWLDKNLKGMVQRAITKEIKRISSGK